MLIHVIVIRTIVKMKKLREKRSKFIVIV